MILLLLAALSSAPRAEEPALLASDPEAPPLVEGAGSLPELWASLPPEAVLEEAAARIQAGDYAGADARLSFLSAQERAREGESEGVVYLVGYSAEMQGRFPEAVASYDAVLEGWPGGARSQDAAFRRALCLEDLGEHRGARDQLRRLQRGGDWAGADALTLDIGVAVNELRMGRERRGRRHLEAALAAAESERSLAWMRSKGRVALAQADLEEAAALPLNHKKRGERHLRARARLMDAAEKEVVAAARLGQADQILEGLILVGDAYLRLRDDLAALPPPASLTADQVPIYEAEIGKKLAVLEKKAWSFYNEGVNFAVQAHYSGPLRGAIEARRDQLGATAERS